MPTAAQFPADGQETEANATIALLDGATQVGTTTASATGGAWSITLSNVADGAHTYTATATDAAGNTSTASNARHVTVDTKAPDTTISSGPTGTSNATTATKTSTNSAGVANFFLDMAKLTGDATYKPFAHQVVQD